MRWIWLAVLVACGDNVVPRLEAVTYDLDGATYVAAGQFHDRARGESCTSVRWGDGATYCTPALASTAYTDGNCSQLVAMASSGYVASMSAFGLHSLRAISPRAPLAQYWLMTNGVCTGPYPAAADSMWGDIAGDELDESAFVRLYRSAPEGSGRLQVISLYTLDGLRIPIELYDSELKVECDFGEGRDRDHVSCAPSGAFDVDHYADASCTVPLVVAPGDAPAFVRIDCDAYAAVGDEVTSPVYEVTSNGCQPAQLPTGWHVYSVGGSPVQLADATRVRQGDARIQPIEIVAGTARVADRYLHDTMLDADCWLMPYSDALRCVPPAAPISTYFAEDTCMVERDVAVLDAHVCGAPERFAFRDAYHAVGAIVTDALYVPSTGDRCMLQPPDGEPHAIGPALAAETFVPAL